MPALAIPYFQLRKGAPYSARWPRIVAAAPNRSGGLGAFSEFYFQAGGSNLNSGHTNDSAAYYIATNGNWSTTTNIYIPTDGSNPVTNGVKVGDFGSLYADGAAVTVYIARITGVTNAVNGPITFSTLFVTGVAPTTSTLARTLRVGGAMLSPFNATGFPLLTGNNGMQALRNLNDDRVRINFKNDQTYNTSGGSTLAAIGTCTLQGYTNVPGDGGKAIWSSSATIGGDFIFNCSMPLFIDIIFQSTGAATNANNLIAGSNAIAFVRCVFKNARGNAIDTTSGAVTCVDCEFMNWNRNNATNTWAILGGGTGFFAYGCYFHDAVVALVLQGALVFTGSFAQVINCIFQRVAGYGVLINTAGQGPMIMIANCDFYSVGTSLGSGDAIRFNSASVQSVMAVRNCNFLNCGRGIAVATTFIGSALLDSNGYGTGSMANSSPDILRSSIEVGKKLYPANTTPWKAPDTGDFSLIPSIGIAAGYAAFTEVDGTNMGTVSYPDIGAAQHRDVGTVFNLSENTFPDGFVNHPYVFAQTFSGDATASVISGTLPDGLSFTQVLNKWQIAGTPTTVGNFSFTTRIAVGAGYADYLCHIAILADPATGGAIGGIGGG